VPETTASASSPTASASPSLALLKERARSLERRLIALVVVVALAPPTVFFAIELSRSRERARTQALHFAALIGPHLRGAHQSGEAAERVLGNEMLAAHCPGFLRIRDAEGQELIRLGERVSGALPSTVQRVLPVSMAPMHDIEISVEDGPLLQDAARVLAIHLLVGLVLGLGFFRTPVRALRRAIRELDETHAQLLQSDKIGAIGEAYAGLTHEINNPLAIILSRVRLMRAREQEKRLDAEVSRDLEVIERQGSRIAELVRGLLAFARKRDFHMRETDLNQVVQETAALIRKPFEKKGITIRTELARSLPRLWASPPHLQQVFLNLLNNARDAMPEGGRIVIRTLQVDGSLVAEVEDSGTGLAQGVGDRVFEPFFTTKQKGTGLGLSVSYGTIKAHAGEMTVESETGKGTLFRVTLPIERRALK